MKKIKNLLKFMLIAVIAVGLVVVLVGCKGGARGITNLTYNGEVISWTSVNLAGSYKVKINGGAERTVQQSDGVVTFQYDAKGEDFEFSVEAVIKEGSKRNPRYTITFKNLGQVEGLSLSDGVLNWTDIQEADGYEIRYNNSVVESNAPTNNYSVTQVGDFNFQVRATKISVEESDGNYGYYSVWSPKLQGKILSAPTNIAYDSEVISWSPVAGATGYMVSIDGEEYETPTSSYKYTASIADFDLSIRAIGNQKNKIYNSKNSEIRRYTYIAPVTDLNVTDGVLRWAEDSNVAKYRIKIGENVLPSSISTNYYDELEPGTSYTIQVLPIGSGDFYFSSWSNKITVTILKSPTLTFFDNVIQWDPITNAAGYYIVIEKDGRVKDHKTLENEKTTHSYDFPEVGDYTVKIQARATTGTGYRASKYSELLSVKRLDAPRGEPIIYNEPLENDNVRVTFNNVSDAESFIIEVDGVAHKEISRNCFEIGLSSDASEKNLNIKIRSKGKINVPERKVVLDSIKTLTFNLVKLAIPQNVLISENVISWDAVANNNGYIVDVAGTRHECSGTTTSLPELAPGNYEIKVRTRGDGGSVCSSDYSNPLNVKKLSKPTNLNITNQKLTWSAVTGATSYKVKLGNQEATANSNAYDLLGQLDSISEGQGMEISVFAIGNGGTVINSAQSDARTISRLARPSQISVNDEHITWNSTMFNGSEVNQYKLSINGDPTGISVGGTNHSHNIGDQFLPGEYSVKVKAVGNNSTSLDSPWSNIKTFTKLAQVEVSKVGNKYTWSAIAGATKYKYKLSASTTEQYTTNCEIAPDFTYAGTHTIQIRTMGDGGQTTVASKVLTISQEVEAFTRPSFTYTISGNTATISVTSPIAGVEYEVEIGGVIKNMIGGVYELTDYENLKTYVVRVRAKGGYFVEDGKYMIDSNFSSQQTINFP